MRKIILGVAMSAVMMLLAACGGGVLKTRTFTSSQSFTIPAGVIKLETATGNGGPGQPEGTYWVSQYDEYYTVYNVRRNGGGTDVSGPFYGSSNSGGAPNNYCDSPTPLPSNPTYSSTYNCYQFTDTSYEETSPATTGASATGFGRTFPGGTGGPAGTTSFTNVPVNAGQSYSVVVPSGGSITITYYE